jgi:septum formation protein
MEVTSADVDEDSIEHPDPAKNVIQTATLKANAIAARYRQSIIIAADTTVAVDGAMLNKPSDAEEAKEMLGRLRGRTHQVYTGLVLLHPESGKQQESVCCTDVIIRDYTDDEVQAYIDSGDPFDKAGAYAIQNSTFHPVATIRGCYTNVVGLPLCRLRALLGAFGLHAPLPVDEKQCDSRRCETCQMLMAADDLEFF